MAHKTFIPRSEGGKNNWLINFDDKLGGYQAKFTLKDECLAGVHADRMAMGYSLTISLASKNFDVSGTTYKTSIINGISTGAVLDFPIFSMPTTPDVAVEPGIFKRISALVKTIKAHKNYTEAIGRDLGIIGPESSINSDDPKIKTTLKAKIIGKDIRIKYLKGKLGAILLECRRGAETEFTLVEKVTQSFYLDTRPNLIEGQPEVRQYRAWCVIKDEVIGMVSNTISITIN